MIRRPRGRPRKNQAVERPTEIILPNDFPDDDDVPTEINLPGDFPDDDDDAPTEIILPHDFPQDEVELPNIQRLPRNYNLRPRTAILLDLEKLNLDNSVLFRDIPPDDTEIATDNGITTDKIGNWLYTSRYRKNG